MSRRLRRSRSQSPATKEWRGVRPPRPLRNSPRNLPETAAPIEPVFELLPPAPRLRPPARSVIPPPEEPGDLWEFWCRWVVPGGIFLVVLGAGMWHLNIGRPGKRQAWTPPPPQTVATPEPRRATHITPQTSSRLERIKEVSLVSTELGKAVSEAHAFYLQYPMDLYLQKDTMTSELEEVALIEHFCDQNLFTVEREARYAVEQNSARGPGANPLLPSSPLSLLHQRLDASIAARETAIQSLSEVLELYRRERSAEISVPEFTTPETETAWRESVSAKLAHQRQLAQQWDQALQSSPQ